MAERTGASIWRQTYILLYRNILMKRRNKGQLFQEIFIPFIFCINLMAVSFQPKISYASTQLGNATPVSLSSVDSQSPLAFSPMSADIEQVMMEAASLLNITADPQIIGFATEEDLLAAFSNTSIDTPPFYTGIVFSDDFPTGNLSYKIRLRYGSVSSSGSRVSAEQCRTDRGWTACNANQYISSGFVAIQMVLDHAIASLTAPVSADLPFPSVLVQMFPKDTFQTSTDVIRLVGTLYFLIMFLPFVAILLSNLVVEKEKKIKEVMKIMGMKETPFWLAWSITYMTLIAFISIFIVAFTYAITLFRVGNPFVIYLYFFFYGSSIITFAFMLTPFFNKGLVAGAAGTFFTMIMSVIYFPLGLVDGIPVAAQWACCIFSPVAFGLGMDKAITYEVSVGGLNFDTIDVGEFPPLACLIMLMVDTVLYFILAVYFANVIPGQYGQSKVPWFFLLPSYWRGGSVGTSYKSDNTASGDADGDDIEDVTADVKSRDGIKIHGLKKKFRGKDKKDIYAVNGVSLDIYEGQIFCLLGHNGAGKTTLINLLTGLMDANEGDATIYGSNIRDAIQMDDIRLITGVCNQQNTIFDFLTPPEHLKIYAGLKGIPEEQIETEVQRVLKDVDLHKQTGTLAKDLSGGQQRKLCVGMAIIGNPKVLFLDEPSSGMDPYSRRHMWSLLKKQREGRVTVLTTHFMDEADILSDRKAIVSKGSVRCCGSSLFLKNRFGIGYHLGMVVEQDIDVEPVKSLVQTHVPDAQVGRAHGMELSFTLPLKEVGSFAGLFEELERSTGEKTVASSIGIQSYGVSMTTLEEVFLKLGEDELGENEEAKENGGTRENGASSPSSVKTTHDETTPLRNQPLNITKYLDGTSSFQNDGMVTDEGANNHATVDMNESPLDSTVIASKPVQPTSWEQIKAVMYIQFLLVIRMPVVFLFRIIFPCIYVVLGIVLYQVISFGNTDRANPNTVVIEPSLYMATSDGEVTSRLTALLYQDSLPADQNINDLLGEFDNLDIKYAEQSNFTSLMDVAPHSGAVNAINLNNASYTAAYNDTTYHSIPLTINIMSNALYKLMGALSSDQEIQVTNQPLPDRGLELGFTSSIFFIMFFGIGIINIPTGFAITIIRERQLKTTTQLRVSGMEMWRYWTGHFLIDCPQYALVMLCGVIVVAAFQLPSLTQGGAMFMFILFLIVYTPVTLLVGYCASFLFDDYETAQGVLGVFFNYLGIFMAAPTIVLGPLVSESIAFPLHLVFSILFPPCSVFGTLYYLDKIYAEAFFLGRADQLTFGEYFEFDNYVMPSVLILIIPTIGYFFLLRYLQIKKTGGDARDTCPGGSKNREIKAHKVNNDMIEGEDSDVIDERQNVQLIFDSNKDTAVAINSLRREFVKVTGGGCCDFDSKKEEKTKVAVRNVSLSVNSGEVLGLLGPNGAGKTTTLNTVIAECEPTKGQIRIAGHDITSALTEAFEAMGYCPQIDPLYPDITMREHLNVFAAIKGIHKTDIKHVVDHYMKALDITEHADKKSQDLSGGTKRKLCFAMSMLGDPRVVLLDEPSTGMDPKSKRFLWNTISANFTDKRGAILTTHSMEEADAVCSRVGIMVLGQLKCLGTTQHLKNKYGGGYMLEVKLSITGSDLDGRVTGLHQYVRDVVPDAEVTECFRERITYKIPKKSVTSLATVFSAMEKGKETLGVEEYSFSQSTLEQVFLQFAKEQEEADIDDVDIKNVPQYDRSVSVRSMPRPQDEIPGTAEA